MGKAFSWSDVVCPWQWEPVEKWGCMVHEKALLMRVGTAGRGNMKVGVTSEVGSQRDVWRGHVGLWIILC